MEKFSENLLSFAEIHGDFAKCTEILLALMAFISNCWTSVNWLNPNRWMTQVAQLWQRDRAQFDTFSINVPVALLTSNGVGRTLDALSVYAVNQSSFISGMSERMPAMHNQ